MIYILPFLLAFFISLFLTPVVRGIALKVGAVSTPGGRHIHKRTTARLGGLAIYVAVMAAAFISLEMSRQLIGLAAGVTLLVIVGAIDDIKELNPWIKLFWQVLAAGLALSGGIGITAITNPFGGAISLEWGRFLVELGPVSFHITPLANLLSLLWMVGIINVINFLDGLDGLAAGISGIAALVLFTLSTFVNQPGTAVLALILVGAILGFLPYNFHPARIFMGDSGSYFLGLTLALLAIYSGSKLATAALVLGFTILDGVWTVLRRAWKRAPLFEADRLHLHHLMLDIGLSQRQAVLFLYFLALAFGLVAVLVGSRAKLVALVAMLITAILLIGSIAYLANSRRKATHR